MDNTYLPIGNEEKVWITCIEFESFLGQPLVFAMDSGFPADLTLLFTKSVLFLGEGGASYTTKGTQSQPSALTTFQIPLGLFSNVYGRAVTGLPLTVWLVSVSDDLTTVTRKKVFAGLTGQLTQSDTSFDIELVGKWEGLNTPNPWIVSTNCMRFFGRNGCPGQLSSETFSRTNVGAIPGYDSASGFLRPTSSAFSPIITGTAIGPSYVYSSNYQYAVSFNGNNSTPIEVITRTSSEITFKMDLYPAAIPSTFGIVRSCDKSLSQCKKYGYAPYFAGSPFLEGSTLTYVR